MADKLEFTTQEREETLTLYQKIREQIVSSLLEGDEERMRQLLMRTIETHQLQRNVFGLNPVLLSFQTAQLVVEEIGLRRDGVLAVLLRPSVEEGFLTIDEARQMFGASVARIRLGLQRIRWRSQAIYYSLPGIRRIWICRSRVKIAIRCSISGIGHRVTIGK